MTKAERILDLYRRNLFTVKEIADFIGCDPAYVRVVARQRKGGQSKADKRYCAKPEVQKRITEAKRRWHEANRGYVNSRARERYQNDPDYRARRDAAVRDWRKRNGERWLALHAPMATPAPRSKTIRVAVSAHRQATAMRLHPRLSETMTAPAIAPTQRSSEPVLLADHTGAHRLLDCICPADAIDQCPTSRGRDILECRVCGRVHASQAEGSQ